MLAKTPEQVQSLPSKRAMYISAVLAALAAITALKAYRYPSGGDFGAFYVVAQRVWHGDLDLAYRIESFARLQMDAFGARGSTSWTYPPQFDLLLAPLAFVPIWAAYVLFMVATLAVYLATLRAIAKNNFARALVIVFPAIALNLFVGQNGLLTGTLIGVFCINAQKRQLRADVLAGLALGAMVIKPHLAVPAGIYLLATRRWAAIAVAAMVVVVSSLLCTLVLGPQIWTAWLGAIREATGYLEQGSYKLYRMISAYATLYRAGMPATGAFWGQAVVACLALLAVVLGIARRVPPSFALGISAMASVMISPYAYDYDLPILGIGLALMLPDLTRLASPGERGIMYGLVMLPGAYGLLAIFLAPLEKTTLSSLAVMALLALLLRILSRRVQPIPASNNEPTDILPHRAR